MDYSCSLDMLFYIFGNIIDFHGLNQELRKYNAESGEKSE